MRRGVFQDADDHASHVIGGDRSVPAGAERDVEQPLADHRGHIEEPLGEVRGPDVGDRHAGPVEDPLGQPVKCRSMALRVLSGGNLRHVHDAIDAGFLRRLGELSRRLDDPRADGVDEVGPLDAAQRRAHLAEVEEVAVDDLDPALLELRHRDFRYQQESRNFPEKRSR